MARVNMKIRIQHARWMPSSWIVTLMLLASINLITSCKSDLGRLPDYYTVECYGNSIEPQAQFKILVLGATKPVKDLNIWYLYLISDKEGGAAIKGHMDLINLGPVRVMNSEGKLSTKYYIVSRLEDNRLPIVFDTLNDASTFVEGLNK